MRDKAFNVRAKAGRGVHCRVGFEQRLPLKCGLRVNIPGLHSVKQNLANYFSFSERFIVNPSHVTSN